MFGNSAFSEAPFAAEATTATIAEGAGSVAGVADVQGVGASVEASQLLYWGARPRQNRQQAALQSDDEDIMLIIQMYMAMEETWQTSQTA